MNKQLSKPMIDCVLFDLESIKNYHEADGVKVYFQSNDCYTIKVIKDEKVEAVYRHGRENFDIKK